MMTGLDTNLLVRYFAQDDSVQSRKAVEVMEGRLDEENPGFVSLVAMTETVWVLSSAYGLSSIEIANIIEKMLQAETLVIQNEQDVFTAMIALRQGTATFADALIGAVGLSVGCTSTLTFDRKAARLPSFKLL